MLGFPDAQILDITGPMEVFSRTARWMQDRGIARELVYEVELVSIERGSFATSSGVRLIAERAYRDVAEADTLLICGGRGSSAVMKDPDLLRWLRHMSPKVGRLGSVCTGALILAQTGLLGRKAATTHWRFTEQLANIDSSIQIHSNQIYVRDGHIYTSAGVTAGMDMALAMVQDDWGQPTALGVAQELVMFLKRPGGQSQFSSQLIAQFSEDDKLRELQLWMLEHLDQNLTVKRLAAQVAMSERNFARRFTASAGMTSAHYVTHIRLEAARRKLEEDNLNISEVARRCGFGTRESMRRTFVTRLGVSPSDYRERFRSATLD